jgi:peptidoglycan hydrolase CwlO-like protein
LSDTLTATRTDGESLAANIEGKAARVEVLQQQLASLTGELKMARRNLDEAETHSRAQDEAIGEERARTAVLAGQLETLEEALATARQDQSQKDRQLQDIDTSAAELAASLLAADEELKDIRDDRERLATELEARDADIASLESKVTELLEQGEATASEVVRQQATISELEAELENKARNLQETAQDLGQIGDLEARIIELDGRMSRSLDAQDSGDDEDPAITRVMVSIGNDKTVKYPLYKSTMTIGRSAESDIQICRQYISRQHAKLCTDQGNTYIEDLGSKNGVRVNASRIKRHRLRNGDLVDLGKIQFKFIDLPTHDAAEGNA